MDRSRPTDDGIHRRDVRAKWDDDRMVDGAAAGIVVSSDSGDTRLRVSSEVQMTSAYDAEVVALAVAGRMLRGATIYPDCQSAMAATALVQHRTGVAQVLRTTDGYGDVRKVVAHAERRKQRSDWTPEEEGNVKADATAAGRKDESGNPPMSLSIRAALTRVTPHWWVTVKE